MVQDHSVNDLSVLLMGPPLPVDQLGISGWDDHAGPKKEKCTSNSKEVYLRGVCCFEKGSYSSIEYVAVMSDHDGLGSGKSILLEYRNRKIKPLKVIAKTREVQ